MSAFKAAVQETAVEATEHGKYRVEGSRGERRHSYSGPLPTYIPLGFTVPCTSLLNDNLIISSE